MIPSPVIAHDMIYAVRGMRGPLLAVKPSGLDELPTTDIAWQFSQGTSDSPSPVVAGDLLLMVANNGISQCFNAHTGQRLWQQRLPGEYRASPVVTEGRVYFLNMQGLTSVISASDKFQILSQTSSMPTRSPRRQSPTEACSSAVGNRSIALSNFFPDPRQKLLKWALGPGTGDRGAVLPHCSLVAILHFGLAPRQKLLLQPIAHPADSSIETARS